MEKLVLKAVDNWNSNERFEKKLHPLLKDSPWLIQPNYSKALTSDKPLSELLVNLNKHLKIDDSEFTPPSPKKKKRTRAGKSAQIWFFFWQIVSALPVLMYSS